MSEELNTVAPEDLHTLHTALTGDKDTLYRLFERLTPDLAHALLRNPALDESHLLALLKRPGLPHELFSLLYQKHTPFADSYQVAFAVVRHPEAPAHIVSTLLPRLYLFDLLKLSTLPGIPPDQKLAAERTIIQRIPTQPLGNKLTLARRGTAAVLEALLREGQSQVVAAVLDNPRLKEGAVHQFLGSVAATPETISQVARHKRWQNRPNLQLALLKNPRTPDCWFMQLLPRLPRAARRTLALSPRLTPQQKRLVAESLEQHP